ncbi:RHS repeat-associated core domain-containing protein [Desnuesiella massiliensis]|uniref:RHS repeat-associated core domain-containing protein n=1 Tax=Desnuesiella massiliensis TaxID=1650662 RepID=UPI0006E374A2|nr:RHS repeat-associated core domain-containing protein [Desnuesiella massiliensis]
MNLNGTEYFYLRNAQGDIIGLIDGDGVRVISYAYDSWGKPIVTDAEKNDVNDTIKDGVTGSLANTVGVKNPYRYRGYRYDAETSLYYIQSRYYSPEWGRFINMDSLGGKIGVLLSHNVFAYCNNNVVNMVDPNGNWAIAISFAAEVIGGILTTAATILSSPVVIAGAAIMATAFLGYAVYTYYTSSSGSASYSAEVTDSGSVEEASSGTGGGGGASNNSNNNKPNGFNSFRKLKKYLGPAGAGKAWHHIVEQTPANIGKFTAPLIHNIANIMKLDHGKGSIHAKISGYYSSIQPFTNGQTVRQWLSSKSFEEQYEFGMKIIRFFQDK